jgi:hypothetical protein
MATGDDFTAYEIINTYKTLLYASDAAVSTIPNEGITGTLKTIRSADGSFTPLQLSSSFVNINGASTLKLNGTTLTATAAELNSLVSSSGTVQNIRVTSTSGLIATQNGAVVSVIDTSATLIVNPSLSVTNFIANTGSFTTKVSGVAAEFSGNVSVNNLFAATNIFIAGTTIASNADVAAVSARVDAVSVLTSINKVDITANTAAITSINTSVVANTAAITSINTVVTGNTTNITANTAAITSINTSVVANTAAITSINSAITSINAGSFHSLDVSTSVQIGDFINLDGSIFTIAAGGSRTGSGQTENIIITNSSLTGSNTGIHMTAGNTGKSTIRFGAPGDDTLAQIFAQNDTTTATLKFAAGNSNTNLVLSGPSGSEKAEFTGDVGIGISTPVKTLHVNGPAISTVVTLTDAASVTSDFDTAQNFSLTLAGNRTLSAPSNVDPGQVGSIFIIQDGTGSRTLAYNTIWKFAGGTAPTLSTDAAAIDRLDYIVQTSTAIEALLTKAYA